ncbi:unnamed protein product [Plutella xylostella]|uniref:(diamondback moth) hypothetical protein n=1 Tax=Plutella xylostella TaxID=51655 RepID=A0A8S4G3I4_PLUXY|nr:unnamed protein product [Plutella xylostella]
MSGSSGAGPPPPDGVVRSSALAFLPSAQAQPPASPQAPEDNKPPEDQGAPSGASDMAAPERLVPAGVRALCAACLSVYPDQPNPLQVTTRLKYWLGGNDPLDYISMYWNPGDPSINVPPHWHYVSFGLSDLHGDGRVHPLPPSPSPLAPSGLGLELTFRLAGAGGARRRCGPPRCCRRWLDTSSLLLSQPSSRVNWSSNPGCCNSSVGNKFCAGDHVSWHSALDGGSGAMRHLLVAADPTLPPASAPHGTARFLQMVGCTSRELRAAQRGSGFDVLNALAEDTRCGGRYLVTDMSRRRSARLRAAPPPARSRWPACPPSPPGPSGTRSSPSPQPPLSPQLEEQIKETLQRGLSCMSSLQRDPADLQEPQPPLSPQLEEQIKETLQRGLSCMSSLQRDPADLQGHMSTDSFQMSSIERALPEIPELMQGSWRGAEDEVVYLSGVHVLMNAESAALLPLAINGRVLHGRHFTYRSWNCAITLLAPGVAGALASPSRPYAAARDWLQILIPLDLAKDMSEKLSVLQHLESKDSESESEEEKTEREGQPPPALPLTLAWPERRIKITVVPDDQML